jgi:hypothetical protein
MVPVLVSGYENLSFTEWFADWQESDNLGNEDFQAGRPIDIAVPVEAYDIMLAEGRPVTREPSVGRERSRAFAWPVAAMLINGRWEEPVPVTREMRLPKDTLEG